MPLLLRLAARNILRQKRRTLLTALSMIGGYVLCVLSFSLSDGSYNNVIRIFTQDHTGHIQIHKDDYTTRPQLYKYISDPAGLYERLDSIGEIRAYAPRIYAPALSYAGEKNTPVQIAGIDPVREVSTSRLQQKISQGQWLATEPDADGYWQAMIGVGVAESLRIGIGDELILISQGADGSVANDVYLVSAIVGERHSWDSNKVFMPVDAARDFLNMGTGAHEIALLLRDENKVSEMTEQLRALYPELSIDPWMVVESTFFKTMESDKRGNDFTMFIIVFIVFIGVLNTVLMSVLERTREFGVLKAIGSRPVMISMLISLETLILALGSILLGMILGTPLIYWFANYGIVLPQPIDVGGIEFSHMTGEFSFSVFMRPALMITAFALLVSIPPGIRAARVPPVAAMGSY
ncbi:MAG: ABC transporter permease [Pseudomonadales bacterium]|nr:ABC transporter permease [Pseudomonadales bacterium]